MGSIFDFNRDGRLGPLEHAIRRNARERWLESIRQSEPVNTAYVPAPRPKTVDPYAWRQNCEYNTVDIDPDDYETEEEYDEELWNALYEQEEWIGRLTQYERNLARQYSVYPEQYVKYEDFRREISLRIEREVSEIIRKRHPQVETMDIPEDAPYCWDKTTESFKERIDDMKISAESKKTFLQETFDLLKINYAQNDRALCDLIGKMAKLDIFCALEMWKTLIRLYPDVLHNSDDFGFSMMYAMEKNAGQTTVHNAVLEDEFLKNAIFSELGDFRFGPTEIIRNALFEGNASLLDELLGLCYGNKFRKTTFYKVVNDVIYYHNNGEISEECFNIITKWINKITSKEEKAKLKLMLLNYMEME